MEGNADTILSYGTGVQTGKGNSLLFLVFPTSDKVDKVIALNKMPWDWLYTESGVGHLRKRGQRGQEVALGCVGR